MDTSDLRRHAVSVVNSLPLNKEAAYEILAYAHKLLDDCYDPVLTGSVVPFVGKEVSPSN